MIFNDTCVYLVSFSIQFDVLYCYLIIIVIISSTKGVEVGNFVDIYRYQ